MEMEIGAIISSLTAHMVLPAGDAKPSWDLTAKKKNLRFHSEPFFEVACIIFRVQRPSCLPIVSKCLVFPLMDTRVYKTESSVFHCLSLICSPANRLQIKGLSRSLLLSGGEPLIGAGADGD